MTKIFAREQAVNGSGKGTANVWWVIIAAVIALVVVLVLLSIFIGKSTDVRRGLSDCEGKGGICTSPGDSCPENTLGSSSFDCSSNGDCCIGAAKKWKADDCDSYVTDVNGERWCA